MLNSPDFYRGAGDGDVKKCRIIARRAPKIVREGGDGQQGGEGRFRQGEGRGI
jgi:hypothetical protein